MKPCVSENLLIRLAGDELEAAERTEVMGHLEECPRCRATWESLRATWDLLGEVTAMPPAHDLTAAVLARAAEPLPERNRWALAARVAAMIALAGGVGIVAGLLTPRTPTLADSTTPVTEEEVVTALGLDTLDDGGYLLAGIFETEASDADAEAPLQEQPS